MKKIMVNEINDGLIDIIEPVAPVMAEAGGWLWIAVPFGFVLLLGAGFFYLWKYKLPAYRSVKRLREVKRQVHAGELTQHERVLVFALELRQGLAIKRLRAEEAPVNFKQQDAVMWVEFIQDLESMLYQSGVDLSEEKLADTYIKIEKWLWRYSR